MPRLALIVLLVCLAVLPLFAQDGVDYRISVISSELSDDETSIEVAFGVINIGAPATLEATAILTVATQGDQLGIEVVPPLDTNESVVVQFTFPAGRFTPGTVQSLQASVGIGEVEAPNSATIGNNTARVGINIPASVRPLPASDAEATEAPDAASEAVDTSPRTFTLPGLNVELNLNNPAHVGALIVVIVILLLLLWVGLIILRLLFQKTPVLGAWQPPYASAPVLDPDSAAGRRQLWQPHAQNDALLVPCAEDTYHIRKLLLGTDSANLSGWRVSAMRLSQYDMYGRVARTHTLAPNGIVKRFDRAAHKPASDQAQALKAVRPVARQLISSFEKKVNKKNAMLPVALDVRLKGTHGETRILFELFGCRRGEWQLIDAWEPEMIVLHGAIHENFTYTMFGQHPGEDYKTYRTRMENEMAGILADMITRKQAVMAGPAKPAETPSVEQYVPQDTAPHPPLGY